MSIPSSLAKEKAGTFTYHFSRSGRRSWVMPWSARLWPSMILVAMSTRETPVDFDRKGTLREARGFTSMMETWSFLSTMNWMLNRPLMPMARPSFSVYSVMRSFTRQLRL